MKNIEKAEVLTLKEQIAYQEAASGEQDARAEQGRERYAFSFDKDEEISTHASGETRSLPALTVSAG